MADVNAEGPAAAVKALRLRRNAEALARAQEILSRDEVLSHEERLALLGKYTGVGGLVEVDEERYGPMSALQQSKAALGQYLTPLPVAQFFAEALAIEGGTVYDNCAGAGRLFAYLPPTVRITAVELQAEAFTLLRAAYRNWPGGAELIHGDCMEYRTRDAFEYALGNPPFGLTWSVEGTAGLESASAHKGHVLSLEAATELQVRAVKAGGFIGLVVPETALERDDLRKWREWMLAQCVEMARIALPRSGDEDPGTRWPCVAWLLQKRPAFAAGQQPVHYPEFRAAPRTFEDLNTTTLQAWKDTPWFQRVVQPYAWSLERRPERTGVEPARPRETASPWRVLSPLKWKRGVLLNEARVLHTDSVGLEVVHGVCAIGVDEYWCMTCASERCGAIEAVLAHKPGKGRRKPKPESVARVVAQTVKRHLRTLGDVPDLTAEAREALRARLLEAQKSLAAQYGIRVGWQRPGGLQRVQKTARKSASKKSDLSLLPVRTAGPGLVLRRSGRLLAVEPQSIVDALKLLETVGATGYAITLPEAIMGGEQWLPVGWSERSGRLQRLQAVGLQPDAPREVESALTHLRRRLAWQLIPRPESAEGIAEALEEARKALKGTPILEHLPTVEAYEERYWMWRDRVAETGIELYEYQAHDAALICMTESTYLSYTPGLGKTRTSLAVALARYLDRKAELERSPSGTRNHEAHPFKTLFVVPPGSVLDMAWADECRAVGLVEGKDFVLVRGPSDMSHPAPVHITSYTRLANKPKPTQLDPVVCPQCGSVVTGERCDNKECGTGLCYVCHQPTDRYARCQNPDCAKYRQEVRKVVPWKRGMEDLCPRCGSGRWNGHYCADCGLSGRQWVAPYYKHAAHGGYDMVVLDEAHFVKNAGTLRGDAMLALRGAKYKLALGGTPIMGFVQDFCRQGQFLFAGDLGRILFPFPMERGSQKAFMDAFAFWVEKTMRTGKRRKVQEAERIKNAELFWRITDTLMIRRANEDPMVAEAIRLPTFTEREVAVEPSPEQLQVIRWVEDKFLHLYRQQLERERRGEVFDLGSFSALMWAARRAATVPSCFAMEYPEEAWPELNTWPKLEAIERVAATCVAEGRKLVIFTGLNPAAQELVNRLAAYNVAPIPLTHTTPPSKRTRVLRAFRMEDSPRIVVMGLLCGNVGLTLTSPRYPIDVLVADVDWSPSQIAQAIKRVYRPSQRYPVTAYTVLTNRSMDMDMLDLVYRKSKGIAQALDKVNPDDVERPTPMSQREMLDELARRIEERQAGEARTRAEALLQQGQTEDALRILGAALALQSLSPEVWRDLYRFTDEVIRKAMQADPAGALRYQADLRSLEDMAMQRQPVEQAELLQAA
ncbi:MAG: hypothetical protein H5T65_11080 [Chloroflexi bacterium]|nr:hypothetical protein [Chloroflexota bacterium]